MELQVILKMICALLIIFILMYVILKLIQKYSNIGYNARKSRQLGGIKVENIIYLDEDTKIVNISNPFNGVQKHYVLALGKQHSLLIDKYQTTDQKSHDMNNSNNANNASFVD